MHNPCINALIRARARITVHPQRITASLFRVKRCDGRERQAFIDERNESRGGYFGTEIQPGLVFPVDETRDPDSIARSRIVSDRSPRDQ